GELIEEEIDLVVAGVEPLSLRRFYNSSAPYERRTGCWRYNPEAFFAANFEWHSQEIFAAVGGRDGSITPFIAAGNCIFTVDKTKGLIHPIPGGQSHPLNAKVVYRRTGDKDNKYRFYWNGEITDGSGCVRTFSSPMHSWLDKVHVPETKHDKFRQSYTPN